MNKYRKIALLICLSVTGLFYGQNKPNKDKIKSLKVAFITEHLELTSKEAEAFWPIYNQYDNKRDELREKEHKEIRGRMRETDTFSEKDAEVLLKTYLALEEEEEELDREFLLKLVKVISAKKTLLLLRSEEDFKRQLIRQYRNRGSGDMH